MFSLVCASGQFTLKFHHSYHLVENISRFESLSALDASLYEQYNTSTKYAICHTSKRCAAQMDERVFRLDQIQTNEPWEKS